MPFINPFPYPIEVKGQLKYVDMMCHQDFGDPEGFHAFEIVGKQ